MLVYYVLYKLRLLHIHIEIMTSLRHNRMQVYDFPVTLQNTCDISSHYRSPINVARSKSTESVPSNSRSPSPPSKLISLVRYPLVCHSPQSPAFQLCAFVSRSFWYSDSVLKLQLTLTNWWVQSRTIPLTVAHWLYLVLYSSVKFKFDISCF